MSESKMTSRERILRAYRHQEADRIPFLDYPWGTTLKRWHQEGLPKDADWKDYFGFDRSVIIYPDNSPRYEKKVLERTDRYEIVTTQWGETRKVFRELDSTPESLGHYYDTPEKWEEAKARILEYHEDRIPWDVLEKNAAKWEQEGVFRQLEFWFGFDVTHSYLLGTENTLIALYEDPDWIKDIFDTYLTVSLNLCQKILDAGYKFDGVYWPDDMGYKGTTFFSTDMYREILKPFQKRAVDWAHERGLVVELHSCGFIEPLLPDLVDVGIDLLNPLEIKAGMNPEFLKKTYGDKLAFRGGINAQIWDDMDQVRAEMERIIPMMKENGGYIFASDHSIPNSVSFENMKAICDLARKLGTF